jgi:hypothetical protein
MRIGAAAGISGEAEGQQAEEVRIVGMNSGAERGRCS